MPVVWLLVVLGLIAMSTGVTLYIAMRNRYREVHGHSPPPPWLGNRDFQRPGGPIWPTSLGDDPKLQRLSGWFVLSAVALVGISVAAVAVLMLVPIY